MRPRSGPSIPRPSGSTLTNNTPAAQSVRDVHRLSGGADPPPTTAQLDAACRDLIDAEVIAFAAVGLRSHVLQPTLAYQTIGRAIAMGPVGVAAVKPRLEYLMRAASPAGQVYAGVLMRQVDPAAARTFWQDVSEDQAPVSTFVGCVRSYTTVSAFASGQLGVAG